MPTWPAALPQKPLVDRYNEKAPDIALRSPMDAGPAKMRKRFTAGVRPVSFEMVMTAAQLTTFDDFYYNTLDAVDEFDWTHPRTGTTESFRFTKPPSYEKVGSDAWRVSINLEEMP